MLEDRPGVVWPDTDSTDVRDAADVIGAPPIEIDPTNTATNVFDWGDQDIDDLIALAGSAFESGRSRDPVQQLCRGKGGPRCGPLLGATPADELGINHGRKAS